MYLNPNLYDYSPIDEAIRLAESEEEGNDLIEDTRYAIEHDSIEDDVYIETARELALKNKEFSMFLDILYFEAEKAAVNYFATYDNPEIDIAKLAKAHFTKEPFYGNEVLDILTDKITDLDYY